jgi:hypothetical protein
MRYQAGFLVVIVALLAPPFAAAQYSTADGIRALARGDTAAALRILRPLADAREPDPIAQFFVATLYDTGSGVAMDQVRACGLYLKAATSANPLASEALALAEAIRHLYPHMAAPCAAASIGAWHEPIPAVFVLGPDHSVTTDASGFAIDYHGIHRTVPTTWGGVEYVFLPTRYTRLDVTRPVATTRHFIEFWAWIPNDTRTPTAWALMWTVCEVSGAEAHVVPPFRSVTSVNGSRPPTTFAVDAVGRLRVNAQGEAERAAFGPGAYSIVIPYGREP